MKKYRRSNIDNISFTCINNNIWISSDFNTNSSSIFSSSNNTLRGSCINSGRKICTDSKFSKKNCTVIILGSRKCFKWHSVLNSFNTTSFMLTTRAINITSQQIRLVTNKLILCNRYLHCATPIIRHIFTITIK